MRDDDQNDPYLWREGEREQVEREMAEREARIKRDEVLEWSKRYNEARATTPAPEVVMKSYTAPTAAPATLTKEWVDYIERRIKRESRATDECTAKAIAQTIGKSVIDVERANTALLERVARLETELAELKGEMKTRAVLAETLERLDRLEAGPRGLRAV